VSSHSITLIPGDGIGPEVTGAALRVLEAVGASIEWDTVEAGAEVILKYGTPVPAQVLDSVRSTEATLKGPIGTPIGGGFRSANVHLRQALDLYACVRPVKNIEGVPSRYEGVDLVVVRENTEGLYSGLEHRVAPGIVESLKIVTERACLRIARYAFELAVREGRGKVCAVHKANIMKLTDGLFLECCQRVSKEFPTIEYSEIIIDACAMKLVRDPAPFEVMVLENLYGDIMSDLCAGLVGGLGVVPGMNIGDNCAVFEAVHGSAPGIAGKGVANPTAVILSAARMLHYLGEEEQAERVDRAVLQALKKVENRTGDIGGTADLHGITEGIIAEL
jgi:isocitrate dehydrogenase (NAD+)